MGNIILRKENSVDKMYNEKLKRKFDKCFEEFLSAHTDVERDSYISASHLVSFFYSYINSRYEFHIEDLPYACKKYINEDYSRFAKSFIILVNMGSKPHLDAIFIGRKIINANLLIC